MKSRSPRASMIARTQRLYVAPSSVHGTGVFAARAVAVDGLVECCPVIVCPQGQEDYLAQTELRGYYFTWQDEGVALALGFGSLYNHSWQPNAAYELDYDLAVVRYYAVRPIAKDDEITINYTGDPDGRGELWFDTPEP
ncbi:MAG: SET domain-containing protein [Actinobacteria bacterium]|nr:SET domain-containing protein [Actinomycetota bacterium]MBW3650018.1 SET domain-containing protein [Actinomycetota bacterium]